MPASFTFPIVLLILAISADAQRATSAAPNPPPKIRVDEVIVSGTTTLDSQLLIEISNSLTGEEYGDDPTELSERLRDAFQQRGYFRAEIRNIKLKPLDPLGNPKPVRIEAEANEGLRYRVGNFNFTGMRAVTSEKLRSALPLQAGDYFDVEEVRAGLSALRDLYTRIGYLNMVPVPNTELSDEGTVRVNFDIDEGQQFRMGTVEFTGDRDNAQLLRSHWQLAAGEAFDDSYPRKFAKENTSLLPSDFAYIDDVYTGLNCREGTVQLLINADPKHPKLERPKNVDCEKKAEEEASR